MSFKKRLLKRIKGKVTEGLGRFSGEFSSAAPDDITPYERGVEDAEQEVVMARLNRPSASRGEPKSTTESPVKSPDLPS